MAKKKEKVSIELLNAVVTLLVIVMIIVCLVIILSVV